MIRFISDQVDYLHKDVNPLERIFSNPSRNEKLINCRYASQHLKISRIMKKVEGVKPRHIPAEDKNAHSNRVSEIFKLKELWAWLVRT